MLEKFFAHTYEHKFPIKTVIFVGILIGLSIGGFAAG